MHDKSFCLKGTIAYTPSLDSFSFVEDGFLVCLDGKVAGVFPTLPETFAGLPLTDYSGMLIIPGMCDLHIHAPQYSFRGIGQNIENSDWSSWFERYAFPDEGKYADLEYANRAYTRLAEDLMRTTTTRLAAFASYHRPATELLMDIFAKKGFAGYIGKVSMDRNSIEGLIETTEETIRETRLWVENTIDKYELIKPIITPRYLPTSTDEALAGLSAIMKEYNLPVHTHLSEGLDEIKWVKELKPDIEFYGEAYDQFDMFGTVVPTIMDHCVFSDEKEFELICKRNIWVAHCPNSNLQGSGTAAPVLDFLKNGAKVGLGTDASGGNTINMMRVILEAILASKVRWAYLERKGDPDAKRNMLSLANAFYLATKGGGSFFGKVGSFEEGYLFDAVVLDDSRVADFNLRSTYERVERMVSLSDDREIVAKYINGRHVYDREA